MQIMTDGAPPLGRALQQLLSSETAGSAGGSWTAQRGAVARSMISRIRAAASASSPAPIAAATS